MMEKTNVNKIVTISLLIALNVVLTRFCAINTLMVKIGFGFVSIAICGWIYGPLYACAVAAAGDFLGAVLFPIGAFNPAFTVSAALVGLVYGIFLHRDDISILNIISAVAINCLIISLCINTYFIYIFYGAPFKVLFISRILQNCIMIPVQFVVIRLVINSRYVRKCYTLASSEKH